MSKEAIEALDKLVTTPDEMLTPNDWQQCEGTIRQALQTREGITSDFPLIDPNQFAVYLSTMKAGEVITEKMIERLNGYMEIITQQYEWPESCDDMVLVPIEPTEEIIDAMEEMFMPFGEMRAAYDGVIMAALKPSSRGEQ